MAEWSARMDAQEAARSAQLQRVAAIQAAQAQEAQASALRPPWQFRHPCWIPSRGRSLQRHMILNVRMLKLVTGSSQPGNLSEVRLKPADAS